MPRCSSVGKAEQVLVAGREEGVGGGWVSYCSRNGWWAGPSPSGLRPGYAHCWLPQLEARSWVISLLQHNSHSVAILFIRVRLGDRSLGPVGVGMEGIWIYPREWILKKLLQCIF